jgi:hypothetical protein
LVINCDYTAIKGNAIYTTIDSSVNTKCGNRKISFYSDKNVLDELYRKLNFRLKLKDGQSKALNNILDGNDVFAV